MMKKYLFLMGLILSSTFLFCQTTAIEKFYSEKFNDEQFTTISVSSKMFNLFVNFERDDPDEQQIIETISKLKGLKMIVSEEYEEALSDYNKMVSFPAREMESLMSISEAERQIEFYITEKDGMIEELMMIGFVDKKIIALSILGDIDLNEIAALSKKMQIAGLENLQNISDK